MSKTFTCREMGGPCDEAFTGDDAKTVGELGGAHIMSSTDDAHAPMKEKMSAATEEDKNKWWDWFSGEWDTKKEA